MASAYFCPACGSDSFEAIPSWRPLAASLVVPAAKVVWLAALVSTLPWSATVLVFFGVLCWFGWWRQLRGGVFEYEVLRSRSQTGSGGKHSFYRCDTCRYSLAARDRVPADSIARMVPPPQRAKDLVFIGGRNTARAWELALSVLEEGEAVVHWVKGRFGPKGEPDGLLVLTNRRVIFAHSDGMFRRFVATIARQTITGVTAVLRDPEHYSELTIHGTGGTFRMSSLSSVWSAGLADFLAELEKSRHRLKPDVEPSP